MSAYSGPAGRPALIPVTVLTGFLGAGKTTLLNRLLRDPALANTVVLINEFGEIALDHLFVEKIDGDMVMMSSGCLCCTMRGELIDSLESLLRKLDNKRIPAFERLIVETTGLADPAPVLHTIMSHPYLLMRFRLDGVVTMIDAINGPETLDAHADAVKQAAVADRLVLSKIDLIQSEAERRRLVQLRSRLLEFNPTARLLDKTEHLDAAHLLDAGLYNPASKSPDVTRWLNAESLNALTQRHDYSHVHGHNHSDRHGESIRTFCLTSKDPLPVSACDLFLEVLRNAHGPNLLRVKGIIALADDPSRPLVIHGVQHVFHPPVRLDKWPDDDRRTRLVFIVSDLDPQFVQGLYRAFAGEVRLDKPDRDALTANPLKLSPGGLLA